MDQRFADFDFESFPEEIKSRPAAPREYSRRRKPITSLSSTFWVCGPADKTQKRLRELTDALACTAIVQLDVVSDAEFEQALTALRELAAGVVSGTASIDIGDNHKCAKCPLKLSCSQCWVGEHGASHITSNWIICNLLRPMYRVTQRDVDKAPVKVETDVWNVDEPFEDDEHGSYRYIPHEKQNYTIQARPRLNASVAKIHNLFRTIIPSFFAGTTGMPRIGALRAPQHNNKFTTEDKVWCKKPYCTRTLLAPAITDRQGQPVCNKFHSDESSFLTSLLRILVECHKVARAVTVSAPPTPPQPRVREHREPKPAPQLAPQPAPVTAHNAFSLLSEPATATEAEPEVATVKSARLEELEQKLATFIAKNGDTIKVNRGMRDRRDRLNRQIDAERERIRADTNN